MFAVLVVFGHDVEEEWLDVIVKSLAAEKEFGEETEILTIYWILAAIDFEERKVAVSIDFVTGWVFGRTFELDVSVSQPRGQSCDVKTNLMPPRNKIRAHILQAKFAYVQHPVSTVLFWIRRSMPCIDLVLAEIDAFDSAWRT